MSRIDKLIEKFYRKPIPNDITYSELEKIAKYFNCEVENSGGKHPFKIIHRQPDGIVVVPKHGKTVKEVYIKQAKELFDKIQEGI